MTSAADTPPGPVPPGTAGLVPRDPALPDGVAELAAALGVTTGYLDARDQPVAVPAAAVGQVLGLLGVDLADPAGAAEAVRGAPWRRLAPASVVTRASAPEPVTLRVAAGLADADITCSLELEDGTVRAVPVGPAAEQREVDGATLVARPAALPGGLPHGDHILRVAAGGQTAVTHVVAVPDRVPQPAAGRMWGWMVQLYALRSAGSWGMGDYADLATIAAWSASEAGGRADVLLVNPLHATAPTLPVQPSPYYPASRRFLSPLYLRPELTPEYAAADPQTRAAVDGYAVAARKAHHLEASGLEVAPAVPGGDEFGALIDRDAVWEAKRAALELLFSQVPGNRTGNADGGENLLGFATWCALTERHGPDWRAWPAPLRDRDPSALAEAGVELADRIAFHRWLQVRAEEQVAAAQAAARAAGMRVGIVHDLAVGVDPGGADTWADGDAYATGASIGAPPDTFNQQGQDWGLPPWRPDRLAESAYAPLRRMIAAVLRRGGGLRVDHILGLFRLWWIPSGAGAPNGTYVRYDAEATLGVLALEAERAGALIVGEDLGTVEPTVATTLDDFGVFGSSVLWFENDADGVPLPADAWRERTMASVTTHDLPTAAGFLRGEHVRARAQRGLLARPVADEVQDWRDARDGLLTNLRLHGLLDTEQTDPHEAENRPADLDPEVVRDAALGMHRFLAATPARIVLAAPGDAVGDRHQPNLPGTVDSYPNWRLPLRDDSGVALRLEELMVDPRVLRLASALSQVHDGASGASAG